MALIERRIKIKPSLAALLLTLSASAIGASVNIDPMGGEKTVKVEPSFHITGSCGGAIVRVLGAINVNDETFGNDPDGTVVIIRKDARHELRLTSNLSDHNKIDCVTGKTGRQKYLVLATNCDGSLCGDAFSYIVVDPRTLQVRTPLGGVSLDSLMKYL